MINDNDLVYIAAYFFSFSAISSYKLIVVQSKSCLHVVVDVLLQMRINSSSFIVNHFIHKMISGFYFVCVSYLT